MKFGVVFRIFMLLSPLLVSQGRADIVRFMGNPKYSLEARVSVLESAEREIFYQVYQTGTTDDQLTMQFLTLMYRASLDPMRPNLNVYIVLDSLAQKVDRTMLAAMMRMPDGKTINPRMHIRLFDQFIEDPFLIDNRMHNKLLVADAKYAIVGGRNLTQDYFDLDCASVGDDYVDTDVLVQTEPAAALESDSAYQSLYDEKSADEVARLSTPEKLQRYAYLFFRNKKQVRDPVTVFGLSESDIQKSVVQLQTSYNELMRPNNCIGNGTGSCVVFIPSKAKHLAKVASAGPRCSSEDPLEVALGKANADQNLSIKMREHGAKISSVEPLFDPPAHPLVAHESDDIAMELQAKLIAEFSPEHVFQMALARQNPQLIIISPYVSMTPEMSATLTKIKANIDTANLRLQRPVYFDLQIITNSDLNADVHSAQVCFDKQAAPQYLALGAKVFEYKAEVTPEGIELPKGRIHQKMYFINHSKIFVGSFNSDYRSSNLNLELGVYFDASAKDPKTTEVREGVEHEIMKHLKGYSSDKIARIKAGVPESGTLDLSTVRPVPESGPIFDLICHQE